MHGGNPPSIIVILLDLIGSLTSAGPGDWDNSTIGANFEHSDKAGAIGLAHLNCA